MTPKRRILVVDDEDRNLRLMEALLVPPGYEVGFARDGEEALRKVQETSPDVILLDVMMPKLNGFEVCRRLKSDPKTAPIPVLMVTALSEREERLRGIDAGADDFLTKPVDTHEVILRVRNAVRAKHQYDQLQQSYEELRELEELRDNLVHMIIHDMRSPLTGLLGGLELLQMEVEDQLDEGQSEDLRSALDSSRRLNGMVTSLLDISRLESGKMPLRKTVCDVSALIAEALDMLGALTRDCKVSLDLPADPLGACCDADVVRRIIVNLVGNSIKFTPGGEVRIHASTCPEGTKVSVIDTGSGIPAEYQEKIFEKFGQVEAGTGVKRYSTGLGLTFCKLAVEAHGGRICVESELGKGSTFWFTLPDEQS